MILSFAPMEGLTSAVYRRTHRALFPQADLYYSPFIAPDGRGEFKSSRLRDILGENNSGVPLVPQLLASQAEAFLGAARRIAELGYEEVNLNLGCPSATVVSKHKGAGMLRDPAQLDGFLADVFSRTPLAVSVKSRLGFSSPDEIDALMEIFNRYPIRELILHARHREGYYRSPVALEAFSRALERANMPVVYNGSIFTGADYRRVREGFPSLSGVMLGRGAIANPALFRTLRGGEELRLAELCAFHAALVEGYLSSGLSASFTCAKMKELWFYLRTLFPDSERPYKALTKARDLPQLVSCAETLFSVCEFAPERGFQSPE